MTKRTAWTIFALWVISNSIAYIIFSPLIIVSNLAWFIYLITKK